jgi:hypothetical protein
MAVLQSFANVWEARLAKEALAAHGIVAVIRTEPEDSAPSLLGAEEKRIRLLVDEKRFQNAFDVLRTWGDPDEDTEDLIRDNEPTTGM